MAETALLLLACGLLQHGAEKLSDILHKEIIRLGFYSAVGCNDLPDGVSLDGAVHLAVMLVRGVAR